MFNYKPMLSESNVASLLGYGSTEQYIHKVMNLLKSNNEDSRYLKEVIKSYFIPKEEEKNNDLNVKRKDEKSFKNNKK